MKCGGSYLRAIRSSNGKGMAALNARVKSAKLQARRAAIRVTAIERELGTRYTKDTLRALKKALSPQPLHLADGGG